MGHFLKQDNQLVLFFLSERGHELLDAMDALWQYLLKESKRLLGEFNSKHAFPLFPLLLLSHTLWHHTICSYSMPPYYFCQGSKGIKIPKITEPL